MKQLLIFVVVLATPVPALAAGSPSGLLVPGLKMVAGLAVVLGLLYLLHALSRKGLFMMPGAKQGLIRIVEVRSLGGRKGLCLVEVRGQELLLGFGPERIECLARLEPGAAAKGFARQLDLAQAQGQGQP
ncbi:MAG: flagellar biosynthetic protein FliO [Desulfobacterales bacterium]|nr:flagellar biosynthetic protein FliO [Desulfobacterales bacterium]